MTQEHFAQQRLASSSDASGNSSDQVLLREAVDHVDQGIVIVDSAMRVCFVNAKARSIWGLSESQCSCRPTFTDFIYDVAAAGSYDLPADELAGFVLRRFDTLFSGDPAPVDIRTREGRIIRAQVTPLPSGGRMLTYVDITDLVNQAAHFRQLANIDPLTGLPNRREFLARARIEWDRFRRYGSLFSVAFLDIDHFKKINDQFGHAVGDRALLHVASILQHGKRSLDLVARVGGEEFSVLMPNTGASDALTFAERLRGAVANFPLYVDQTPISLTISLGLAQAEEHLGCAESVVAVADRRLYAAKHLGRNRSVGPANDPASSAQ